MVGRHTVLKGCNLRVQSRDKDIEFTIDTFFETLAILLVIVEYQFSSCSFVYEVSF